MSRFTRWLDRGRAKTSSSSLDLTAEAQNMDRALKAAEKIMDDDIIGAEADLASGDSVFHKLARGTLGFIKATLGFEQEVMNEAANLLAEAENSAYNYQSKAHHDHTAYSSAIYDKGTEFALCQAEAQIMSAVVGVLNESITESIKGFYKMRKAYMTLESIMQMEQNFIKARGLGSLTNSRRQSTESLNSVKSTVSHTRARAPLSHEIKAEDLSDGSRTASPAVSNLTASHSRQVNHEGNNLADAADSRSGTKPSPALTDNLAHTAAENALSEKMSQLDTNVQNEGLHVPNPPVAKPPLSRTSTAGSRLGLINEDASSELFANAIDVFIHSGTNLMFGIISLMISVIPPAFAKILSIVGFRGNREKGMSMLWQASKFNNVNGGIAALVLFGWYNGLAGFCDIISDSDPTDPEEVEGYPIDRLKALLTDMRQRYPQSHLWMIEEARMAAAGRNLDLALQLLSRTGKSQLKQLEALQMFETSLDSMNSHRYDLCAESFLKCVDLNAWSQALYYYIAGAAYFTKARNLAKNPASSPAEIKKLEKLAEENFKTAPQHVGKKKMMGKQLPFDAFVLRKYNKWQERSVTWNCSFLDAIGAAPLEEMQFLWNGFKKMNPSQLQASMDNLDLFEQRNPSRWETVGGDEHAVSALLRASIFRNMKQFEEAKKILTDQVFALDRSVYSGQYKETWPAPTGYYEYAVNLWQQRAGYVNAHDEAVSTREKVAGMEDASLTPTADQIKNDRALVAQAKEHVEKAKSWGGFELDARIGIKLTAATGAIAKWEKQNTGASTVA